MTDRLPTRAGLKATFEIVVDDYGLEGAWTESGCPDPQARAAEFVRDLVEAAIACWFVIAKEDIPKASS